MHLRGLSLLLFHAATVLALSFPFSAAFAAEPHRWQVRAGGYSAVPDLGGGAIPVIPGASTELSSDQKPGFAVTWFASEHLAVEVFISPPFEFDLEGAGSLQGTGAVGRLKSLAPLVLGQWYFAGEDAFARPYVGAGIAYSIFYDEQTTAMLDGLIGAKAEFDFENKLSWIAQVGVDIPFTRRWFGNLMMAYLPPDTEAHLSVGSVSLSSDVTISAWVAAVGVGYRF
jgi:outer membrane protein